MDRQYNYNLYVGLTTKNNKKLNTKKVIKTINNLLTPLINGFTIVKGLGFWNGTSEQSIIINIINSDDIDFIINYVNKQLCKILQQHCILITKNVINVWGV